MHRRWPTRALIALATPVLALAATTPSATAAESGAQVPSIDDVAAIYQHLEGGTASESAGKVYGPGKKCRTTKVIKGASQRSASYSPDYSSGDPDVFAMTGEHPGVSATAMQFPSTKAAVKYLHGYAAQAKKCPGTDPGGGGGGGGGASHCKSSMKKIKFSLGDERWGYQIKSTCKVGDRTTSMVLNSLFARQGRFIVYTSAMSMDATAPSIPKSIDLTDLALESV